MEWHKIPYLLAIVSSGDVSYSSAAQRVVGSEREADSRRVLGNELEGSARDLAVHSSFNQPR